VTTTMVIVLASAALVILLLVAYWVTMRFKKRLDEEAPPDLGLALSVTISEESTRRLSKLSTQPVFIKQSGDGTRVQIENRPLVPLTMLTDRAAVLALREVIMAASNRYGSVWTGLVSIHDEVGVTVKRLS
jgi:hypothetical protein